MMKRGRECLNRNCLFPAAATEAAELARGRRSQRIRARALPLSRQLDFAKTLLINLAAAAFSHLSSSFPLHSIPSRCRPTASRPAGGPARSSPSSCAGRTCTWARPPGPTTTASCITWTTTRCPPARPPSRRATRSTSTAAGSAPSTRTDARVSAPSYAYLYHIHNH